MRHQRLRTSLGLKTEPRQALLTGLACQLAKSGRIQTTLRRAKAVQPFVDRMIMLARGSSLHARRQLVAHLRSPGAAESFISEISPSTSERQGGFTRIIRSHRRIGDGAEMVLLEFIDPIKRIKRKEISKEKKVEKKVEKEEKGQVRPEEAEKGKPKKNGFLSRFFKQIEKISKWIFERIEKIFKKEEKDQVKPEETEKEKPKKGGFLSALRKFLKGEE